MVDKKELARRLMATFLEELHDNVDVLNRTLLALERDPASDGRAEQINDLFRCAHTVKGAARAVEVELIEEACHRLEDILSDVRDGQRDFTAALFSLLFKSVDAIEEAGMRLREEQDLADAPLQALLPELELAAEGKARRARGDGPGSKEPPPAKQAAKGEGASATEKAVVGKDLEPSTANSQQTIGEDTPTQSQPGVSRATATDTATAAVTTSNGTNDDAKITKAEPILSPSTSSTIRVAAQKLDSLLAQTSELLVARRRVEYRALDAADLRELVGAIWSEWRELEKPLRTLFDDEQSKQDRGTSPLHLSKRTAAVFQRTGRRLAQLEKEAERLKKNMSVDGRMLAQTCDALNDEVYLVRMLPFAEACRGLDRVVRDLGRATGKQVEVVVKGEEVEVDRSVLEGLKDPLIHLVRNAVDHGVEPPDEREVSGKDPLARISVSAELRGGQVEVVVADDGRGFDLDRIREKVRNRGLAEPQDERELVRMIFLPGFSTAPIVTDVSGRGVGLDVVENRIQSLHGAVDVSFIKGSGTRFTMTVPLTLTTIRSLLTVAGGQVFALPTANVRQIVRFLPSEIRSVSGRDMLLLGGTPVPVAVLAGTLGQQEAARRGAADKLLAIVLRIGGMEVAFIVDEVTAEQDILVKSLGSRVRRIRHVSGATLLPSGKVALVLNAGNIIRTALDRPAYNQLVQEKDERAGTTQRRLLIVEDSVTTRTLMKSILESSGYDVTTAVDGQQALEILQQNEFDVVVSDVDMPRTDGFELTRAIRSSSRVSDLPVILVTARETDEDKARGIEVGANAYLLKRSFDQRNLLQTIEQLL